MNMNRLLATTLALLLPSSTQGQCTPLGAVEGVTDEAGVNMSVSDSEVTCNNLGGVQTDACTVREIRYSGIGTDYGLSAGVADDIPFDLVVRNLTQYSTPVATQNGIDTIHGNLGNVQVLDDSDVQLEFSFVVAGGDPDVPEDAVSLSTPFDVIFYDLDYGESMRLVESITIEQPLSVTTIEQACIDLNQPTPCLTSNVIISELGNGDFTATAGVRGTGADNLYLPEQILQPVANMNDFSKMAAQRYINVTFLPDTSSFKVTFALTPAAEPGTAIRNFQYTFHGRNRQVFGPCSPPSPPAPPMAPPPPSPPPLTPHILELGVCPVAVKERCFAPGICVMTNRNTCVQTGVFVGGEGTAWACTRGYWTTFLYVQFPAIEASAITGVSVDAYASGGRGSPGSNYLKLVRTVTDDTLDINTVLSMNLDLSYTRVVGGPSPPFHDGSWTHNIQGYTSSDLEASIMAKLNADESRILLFRLTGNSFRGCNRGCNSICGEHRTRFQGSDFKVSIQADLTACPPGCTEVTRRRRLLFGVTPDDRTGGETICTCDFA